MLTAHEVIEKVNGASDAIAGREMGPGEHHEGKDRDAAMTVALHGDMPVGDVIELVEIMGANALSMIERYGARQEVVLGMICQSILAGVFIGLEACP